MDDELRQYLEGMEARSVERDRETEARSVERDRETEARLTERMRDMQTELLKAFGPWQENIQVRVRQIELAAGASDAAVKTRMDILERRLAEIEKKLLMNPPAA